MAGNREGVIKAWAKRLGVTREEVEANYRNGLSWCYICRQWQPLNRFATDKSRPTGRKSVCRPCGRYKHAAWAYGLTIEEAKTIRSTMTTCCICGRTKKMVVDHNHKTGKVRGYLCGHCNLGLGHFRDNITLLKKAIAYLEKNDG